MMKNFSDFLNEAKGSGKYPELDKLAGTLAEELAVKINKEIVGIESKMIYKAQYVLEEVIKDLQARV